MGKVHRGRKKNHTKKSRNVPARNVEPDEPSDRNPVGGQDEGDHELPRVTGADKEEDKFINEKLMEETQPPLMAQPLFFSDLPEKFDLVNVPLFSQKSLPLLKCDVCTCYAAKATVSGCGHKFCIDCVRVSQPGQGVFCQYCRKQFPYSALDVSDELLARVIVSCRCGLEANLVEMKCHQGGGGRCQDSSVQLIQLLHVDGGTSRSDRWRQRTQYLRPSDGTRRRDRSPSPNFDIVNKTVEKNPNLPHVYLDLEADGVYLGRVYIELHEHVVPKTVAKFLDLIRNRRGYHGSEIDFVMKDELCQVQQLTGFGRNVAAPCRDENFDLKHDKPGAVAMANFGPDTNHSGFYMTTKPMPWRDGRNVVFGYVIHGVDRVARVCELGREDGSCSRRVRIKKCGVVVNWMLPSVFDGFELFESTEAE